MFNMKNSFKYQNIMVVFSPQHSNGSNNSDNDREEFEDFEESAVLF